jgi:plastocyanin
VTFTASGGQNGYNWGGSGSGTASTDTVSFPNVGTYTVTVSSPAGGNYTASNTATATITVTAASQTVAISPASQSIVAGGSISFTASGGQNGYNWGSSASGTGTTQAVTFPNVGTYSVTVVSPAGGNYSASNTATATITVTAGAQTVAISPTSQTINAGGSVAFTASGGQNGYHWGGSGSGTGSTDSVTFPNVGTYTVSVSSPAGGSYSASNTATATVTVNPLSQTITVSPVAPSITAGQSITFTASGSNTSYTWGGSASGSGPSQTVTFPAAGTYTVTVYAPSGGTWAQSNTASANVTVMAPQPQNVMISPPGANITAGSSVTFTASGGNTSYVWGGSAYGSGPSQTVTFPTAGSYTVTVYAAAAGTWAQSNIASANVNVMPAQQQNVMVMPPSSNITAGQSVTFNASGSNTSYVWGGSASGSGPSQTITFPAAGNYTVTVYAPSGGTWAQSNIATANVTVVGGPPARPQNIMISPPNAFLTAGGSVTFTASNGFTNYIWGGSASGSGPSQTVTFPTQGTYTVTVYAAPGGGWAQSNTASANVNVMPAQPQNVMISPPNANIVAGQSVSFTATGGNTSYIWGGSASGSGPSQTVTFPTAGTYAVTVYAPAGGNWAQSNTASVNVNVTPTQPQNVMISPPVANITAGQPVTFTAFGGNNGYSWGGSASGSGPSQSVTFPNVGTFNVTVSSPAGGIYAASNTATTTINVTAASQTIALSPVAPSITAGSSVTLTATGGQNGYFWSGGASGTGSSQSIPFPNVGSYTVSVVSPAGGNYLASNTATATITVTPASQTVAIAPANPSVVAGGSVSFTASGGQNGYTWGGSGSGSGTTDSVTFPKVGSYTVSVSSPAGGNYSVSNTATANITVNPAPQTISVTPASAAISAGGSVTVTASGSSTGYNWGGVASGSGASQTVSFPNTGTYTITATAPASGNYQASNTATATVTVGTAGQTVSITPSNPSVQAGQSLTFTASGGFTPYVWGGQATGSGSMQTPAFGNIGTYSVTVQATAGGNYSASNVATALVTATPIPQIIAVTASATTAYVNAPVVFTASGGSTSYSWGGAASGSAVAQTLSWATAGSYTVTVQAPAGGNYTASNVATATVTILSKVPAIKNVSDVGTVGVQDGDTKNPNVIAPPTN